MGRPQTRGCYNAAHVIAPKPHLVSAVVVAVLMGAIGFLPLFGGPGYEHALASGLVVPGAAAIATALWVARERTASPLASVAHGIVVGAALAAVSLATALLHVLRVGICELWGALLYYVLTAGAGAILGGVWGAVAGGVLFPGMRHLRLRAVLLALAAPLGGVALGLVKFYQTPIIFAYDPFVGYFSGTLYDTVIDAGPALLTYRLGSLATVSSVVLLASVLERTEAGYHVALGDRGRLARAGLGLALGLASVGMIAAGTALGHDSTTESMREALGAEKHGARCDVVYPSTTREQDALLLVKDCDEQLASVERAMGVRGPERVRAFFFRDANEKKRLMGAAHTYIAKPWREEVYLQVASYPHPVLGHELAHVVAGTFGRGPFRIAGELGGLLPNPGLIEGIAVAASPHDDDLTDAEWAHAMLEIGILPPMQRVFSLGFLGESSAKSYTLAGAFMRWVGDRFGWEVVRAWYGGGEISSLVGMSWAELDAEFRAYVQSLPLSPEAASFARAKFERPGIFGRRCPHAVDALRREADERRDAQRFDEAVDGYGSVLRKDPTDFASRHSRAQVFRLHLDRPRGLAELEELATDERTPRSWRDRAAEALADADFLDGELDRAALRYGELAARSLDEDAARTFEVKSIAARDPEARAAVRLLLLGDGARGPDVFAGGVALGAWQARVEPRPALASYLIGRNLLLRGFIEAGARTLDDALAVPAPTPRIARETFRQRAIAACAMNDLEALGRLRGILEGPDDPFRGSAGGRREATLRLIDRCAR
jgi:hypothetical protein